MRIDKLLSDAKGITRSESRKLIKSGRVSVNGIIEKDIAKHYSEDAKILVDGVEEKYQDKIYIMMNKPKGYISATEDKKQQTVLSLLDEKYKRYNLFPAGRLDIDSEGFLLLTNDGQCAHNMLSPKKHVPKTYLVHLELELDEKDADILRQGVDIGGYVTKGAQVVKKEDKIAHITISEGKFHQVKRMFESVGNKVVYLKRISFGGIDLDESLKVGEYRHLTDEEIKKLDRS